MVGSNWSILSRADAPYIVHTSKIGVDHILWFVFEKHVQICLKHPGITHIGGTVKNGWVSSGRVCHQTRLPCLVSRKVYILSVT